MALIFSGFMVGASGQARAGILLNLINPGTQTNTPFALAFTANALTTSISIAGYQVPSAEEVTQISVLASGSATNLLGGTWVFTPAPSGSIAFTFSDGTSVPALEFAGVTVGSYDTFTQTLATVIGQSYTLNFLFTNSTSPTPSGLLVTTTGTNAVPEPSSLALCGIAAAAGLAVARSRRGHPAA